MQMVLDKNRILVCKKNCKCLLACSPFPLFLFRYYLELREWKLIDHVFDFEMKLPKISVKFVVAQPLALITFWISLCEHYLWIIYGPSIWWCTSRHHMEYILTWWRRFVNKWWPTCMIRHLMNQGHFLKINLNTLSRFLINSVVEVGTDK